MFAFDFSDAHWTGALGLQYKRTLGANLAILAAADWTTFLNDRDNVAFTDAVAGALGLQLQIFPGLSLFGNVGVDVPLNENAGFDTMVAGPLNAGLELARDPQRGPGHGRAVLEPRRRGRRHEHGLSSARALRPGPRNHAREPRARGRAVHLRLRAPLPVARREPPPATKRRWPRGFHCPAAPARVNVQATVPRHPYPLVAIALLALGNPLPASARPGNHGRPARARARTRGCARPSPARGGAHRAPGDVSRQASAQAAA